MRHHTSKGFALIFVLSALLILFAGGAWMLSHLQNSIQRSDALTDHKMRRVQVEDALDFARTRIQNEFLRLSGMEYTSQSALNVPFLNVGDQLATEESRLRFLHGRWSQINPVMEFSPLGNQERENRALRKNAEWTTNFGGNASLEGVQMRVTFQSPSILTLVNDDGYRQYEILYQYTIEARTPFGETMLLASAEGEARLVLAEPPFSRWANFQMTGNWIAGETSSQPNGGVRLSAPVKYYGRVHYGSGYGPDTVTLGGAIEFLEGFTLEDHTFTLRSAGTELWNNARQYHVGDPNVTWPAGTKPTSCSNPAGTNLDACQEKIDLPSLKPAFSQLALGLDVDPYRGNDPTFEEQVSASRSIHAFKGTATPGVTGLPEGVFVPVIPASNQAAGIVVNGDVDRMTSVVKKASQISALDGKGLQHCSVQELSISMTNGQSARIYLPSDKCRSLNYVNGSQLYFVKNNDQTISFSARAPSRLNLHVEDAIDKLGGAIKDRPAIAENLQMTISAKGKIRISDHITYEGAQSTKMNPSTLLPECETYENCRSQDKPLLKWDEVVAAEKTNYNTFPVIPEGDKTILGLASYEGSVTVRTEGYHNHRKDLSNLESVTLKNPLNGTNYTQHRHPDDAPNNINLHLNVYAVFKQPTPRPVDYLVNENDNHDNLPHFGIVRAEGFGPEATDQRTIWKTGSKLRTDLGFRQKIKLLGSLVQFDPPWYGNAGLDGYRSQHAFDRRLQANRTSERLALAPPGWPRRENSIYQQVQFGSGVKIRWMDDLLVERQ